MRKRVRSVQTPHRRAAGPLIVRRGGAVVVEFIVALPILFFTTLAVFEFGVLLLVQQAVTTAAVEGSREGAKVGATVDDVERVVERILGVHNIEIADDADSVIDAQLIVRDENGIAANRGDASLCDPPPLAQVPLAGRLQVTVCVPVTDASGCRPVPDWLSYFGLSLSGKVYSVSSLATFE